MKTPSQEPPASSNSPNQDLKNMDVLCTFKSKIESGEEAEGQGEQGSKIKEPRGAHQEMKIGQRKN